MSAKVVKYVLKDIGPQVPLVDPNTGNVMIIIDGNPIDIPSQLFHAIFREYDENEISNTDTKDLNIFFDAKAEYDILTNQIKEMKKAGISEENLKDIILKYLPNDVKIQDFAKKLIEEAFKSFK